MAETLTPPLATSGENPDAVEAELLDTPEGLEKIELQPEVSKLLGDLAEGLASPNSLKKEYAVSDYLHAVDNLVTRADTSRQSEALSAVSPLLPALDALIENAAILGIEDDQRNAGQELLDRIDAYVDAADEAADEEGAARQEALSHTTNAAGERVPYFKDPENPTEEEIRAVVRSGNHLAFDQLDENLLPGVIAQIDGLYSALSSPVARIAQEQDAANYASLSRWQKLKLGAHGAVDQSREFAEKHKAKFAVAMMVGQSAVLVAGVVMAFKHGGNLSLPFLDHSDGGGHDGPQQIDMTPMSGQEATGPIPAFDPSATHFNSIPLSDGTALQLPTGEHGLTLQGDYLYNQDGQPVAHVPFGSDRLLDPAEQQQLVQQLEHTPGVEATVQNVPQPEVATGPTAEKIDIDHRDWLSGSPEGIVGGNELGLTVGSHDGSLVISFDSDGVSWNGGEQVDPKDMDMRALITDKAGNTYTVPLDQPIDPHSEVGQLLQHGQVKVEAAALSDMHDGHANAQVFATELRSHGGGANLSGDHLDLGGDTGPDQAPEQHTLTVEGDPQELFGAESATTQPEAPANQSAPAETHLTEDTTNAEGHKNDVVGNTATALAATGAAASAAEAVLRGVEERDERNRLRDQERRRQNVVNVVGFIRDRLKTLNSLPPDATAQAAAQLIGDALARENGGRRPSREFVAAVQAELQKENFPYTEIELTDAGDIIVSGPQVNGQPMAVDGLQASYLKDWAAQPERELEVGGRLVRDNRAEFDPSKASEMNYALEMIRRDTGNAAFEELLTSVGLSPIDVPYASGFVSVVHRPEVEEKVATALNKAMAAYNASRTPATV